MGKKTGCMVIYKGFSLKKMDGGFWVKLDKNNKICSIYPTLKVAKDYIDKGVKRKEKEDNEGLYILF